MTAAISYIIAAISIFALLVLWFINTYQVLLRQRQDLLHAEEQVRLHREGCRQMRESPDEQTALRMLETSRKIYLQIEKKYMATLRKPHYRIPGYLMGFRSTEKSGSGKEGEK